MDHDTSLTEDEKKILDDMPDNVVEALFSLVKDNRTLLPEWFNVRVIDPYGVGSYRFVNEKVPEAFDYLEYLMQHGYRSKVPSYE